MTTPTAEVHAYDPRRLRRALALKWERLGAGEYRIWGGRREHYVRLDGDPPCGCEDWYYSSGQRKCKHLLLALMCESVTATTGDDTLLVALQAMLVERSIRQACDA